MIKQHLEEAIKKIEIDRDREANEVRNRVLREKIAPYNAEVDRLRDEAIASKKSALDANILEKQETFAAERKSIIDAAEKKKTDNANAVITAEVAVCTAEYDRHINKLRQQISDVKE